MKPKYFIANLILVIVCSGYFSSSHAQTLQRMEITQVSAPAQGVAVFMDYPDKAAIIIESPITTLRFSSNMNGIVQEINEAERGRYVLIIEPFTQILVIDSPGYLQQRQRIGNPQARDVLYFDIIPEERASDLISVIFNVEPSDAQLFVNGQDTPINQTTQLSPGSVEIRLESEGYRTVTDDVEVNDQNILFTYQLEEIDIVPVVIHSNVEEASVTVDGTSRGEIDRSGTRALFLYPGTYSLQVSQQGYVSQSKPIEVVEDGDNIFTVELIQNIGELSLRVRPADAQILINREDYSGQLLIELAPGRYRLEIEKEYYEPHSETIDIELNQRLSRDVSLEAHTGTLQFSVSPNDAQVELINNEGHVVNQWKGIQLLRNVNAGLYTVKATADEYLPKEQTTEITRNQTVQISLELEEGTLFGTEIVDVYNPATGRTWMDRNLGASRAATSSTDKEAYGDLYQWGRATDGHEKRISATTGIRSSSDTPGHGDFILAPFSPFDWRSPQNDSLWQGVNGVNNPCPDGYRIPTDAEWEAERQSWSSNNAAGAYLSPLKLPVAGHRFVSSGSLYRFGSLGYYWSGTIFSIHAKHLSFGSSTAGMGNNNRAFGYSVRCIKD